jgi:hypothetical protein
MRLPKFHGNYKADMVLDMLDPTGKDLSSGRRLEQKKIHEMGVTSITGMDDSLFVSGGVDGDLVISRWDGNLIKEVLRVPHANTAIDRIQVTADGNRICYLCRNEYAVRYLDWKKLVDELNSLLTR